MKKLACASRGFTLIELLITIAIIGILASIGLVTYPNVQKLARDSQRKSDLKQYQTSLENYANKTDGLYIISTGVIASAFCTTLGMGSCVLDPKDPTYQYKYTGSDTAYVLWAKLEAKTTTTYWRVCSTGRTGEVTVEPGDTSCP